MEDYSFEENASPFFNKNSFCRQSKSNDLNKSCRPFTIKQLKGVRIKEEGSTFYINNKEVTNIVIVGILRSVSRNETNFLYAIEDGTGVIDARVWEMGTVNENAITSDKYVRIYGRLHSYNHVVSVTARKIFSIENPNEITHHLLECIFTHLANGKAGTTSELLDRRYTGSDSLEVSAVKRAINECSLRQAGAYIHTVVVQLKGRVREERIMEIIDDLMNQSKVYSTIDNQHFALVDEI